MQVDFKKFVSGFATGVLVVVMVATTATAGLFIGAMAYTLLGGPLAFGVGAISLISGVMFGLIGMREEDSE